MKRKRVILSGKNWRPFRIDCVRVCGKNGLSVPKAKYLRLHRTPARNPIRQSLHHCNEPLVDVDLMSDVVSKCLQFLAETSQSSGERTTFEVCLHNSSADRKAAAAPNWFN